jgi:hypothetical protein
VVPWWAIEEGPLAVPAPLRPPARANRCVSSLMMTRYHPTVLNEAATADKEAMDKRATEEAVAKRATKERATKEAVVMAAAAEEVAGKIVAPPRYPNVPIGVFGNLSLSSFLSPFFSFSVGLHSLITLFAQILTASPRPPKESLRMWWRILRGRRRWRWSRCQRWYGRRLQRRGP